MSTKPSMREQLSHMAGVHSPGARAERQRATKRLREQLSKAAGKADAFEDGYRVLTYDQFINATLASIARTIEKPCAPRSAIRNAYRQGLSHGVAQGLIYGIAIGAVSVAGLLMLGMKVGTP